MKNYNEINITIPENLYQISDKEIALIHAFCFYDSEGMTKEAKTICLKLRNQLDLHKAIGSFNVWE